MSHSEIKIVGICQVRNEDVYINQALANVEEFCDQILVADHQSRDHTATIVAKRATSSSKVCYQKVRRPTDAHEMIRVYANTPTWIFPVDGDELYDPAGLAVLRTQILEGKYNAFRQIYGHSMHCVELNLENKTARGYLSPPSRTVTKLYNFNAIFDWAGPCIEKCLGGTIRFKPGYSEQSNLILTYTMSWAESPLRLLHTCFLRRSSLDPARPVARPQVSETYEVSPMRRGLNALKRLVGISVVSPYKLGKYMRGPLVEQDATVFLSRE